MRATLVAALGLFFCACPQDPSVPRREFLPEMVDSVPYDAFAPNPVTRDGKTLLAPPAGTVARGELFAPFGPGAEEQARAGSELTNPVEPTAQALQRGEAAFLTYCGSCHGKSAEGDGPVVPKFPTPPSLVTGRAKTLPDGALFHIITHGQGLMGAHGVQVARADRWRIIHHLRRLQSTAGRAEQTGAP